MANRSKRPCAYPMCSALVDRGYCDRHRNVSQLHDRRRGSASSRGYTYKWQQYSKWFLQLSENTFCKLQLPGCTNLSECVDHVDPPDGPDDPRFWDTDNHQGACIHCNSVKGHKRIEGKGKPFESVQRGGGG